jgi:hypothetical protein
MMKMNDPFQRIPQCCDCYSLPIFKLDHYNSLEAGRATSASQFSSASSTLGKTSEAPLAPVFFKAF